ncbi:hypothetical protein CLV62_13628 [Dysgonomonas alginatilytica]|uniref:Uncharacterized protein n=1 Tax=Dysgonomonas alginatilytica TaxID=1605892 RepID=A0A2V3PIH5_9BACT|nr:hypothetical protein CLV62_13628 [Dysgonomonas alginatilytica]
MRKKRLLAFVIDYFIILSISAIIAFLVQSSGIMFTICCSLLISAILNKDRV